MTRCFSLLLVFSFISLSIAQENPKPATAQQIKECMDWSKLPLLEGASKKSNHFNHISYQAPGSFSEAAEFYNKHMPSLGWKVEHALTTHDQKDYLSVVFEKQGMCLSVSGYRSKPEDPMSITVMINGNVNVSLFPKVSDAVVKVSNKNAAYYFTKQKPEEVTSFCRKFMQEQGWKEEPNDMAATWAKEGRHVLTFHQNAMEAVLVAAVKDNQVEVTYSAHVRHNINPSDVVDVIGGATVAKVATLNEASKVLSIAELPRMKNAAPRKRQSTIFALPVGITYEVPDSLEEAVKFYRQVLKEKGCTELTPMIEIEQMAQLYFEKSGFLFGLSVQHDKKENTTSVSLSNHGNVDLRKLPAPPGAKIEPNRFESMNLTTTLSVDEAHEFYRKELSKLGWLDLKPQSKVTMKFTQNAVKLDVEIQPNIYKKTSVQLRVSMK